MRKRSNYVIVWLLIIINALFLVYYALLAYYSRPHYDDLHFLWQLREMSILDYIKEYYFQRSGRFIGYAINGVVFKTILFLKVHQLWPMFFYALGIGGTWYAIKDVIKGVSPKIVFLSVCLFYNIYILTVPDFAVFTWLCAMSYYVLPVAALVLIKLLSKGSLSIIQRVLLFVTALFLGGGQEAYTPIVLLIMFLWGVWLWKCHCWNVNATWHDTRVRRLLLTVALMLMCFIILIIAPGNYARFADKTQFVSVENMTIGRYIYGFISAMVTFFYFQIFYIPYYLVIFCAGFSYAHRNSNILVLSNKKAFLYTTLAFFIYVICSVLPSVAIYGGFGVQRNYIPLTYVLMLYVLISGYSLGNKWQSFHINKIFIVALMLVAISVIGSLYLDIPIARRYAIAVDKRVENCLCLQKEGCRGIMKVQTLPTTETADVKYVLFNVIGHKTNKPQIYYISDADTIPNEYASHFSKLYNLDIQIVCDK